MLLVAVGVYLAIGLLKAFGRMADSNPAAKPPWMITERNPLVFSFYFTSYVLFWPLGLFL